jgi:hypothetical protein
MIDSCQLSSRFAIIWKLERKHIDIPKYIYPTGK